MSDQKKKPLGRGRGRAVSKPEGPWMRSQKLEELTEIRLPKTNDIEKQSESSGNVSNVPLSPLPTEKGDTEMEQFDDVSTLLIPPVTKEHDDNKTENVDNVSTLLTPPVTKDSDEKPTDNFGNESNLPFPPLPSAEHDGKGTENIDNLLSLGIPPVKKEHDDTESENIDNLLSLVIPPVKKVSRYDNVNNNTKLDKDSETNKADDNRDVLNQDFTDAQEDGVANIVLQECQLELQLPVESNQANIQELVSDLSPFAAEFVPRPMMNPSAEEFEPRQNLDEPPLVFRDAQGNEKTLEALFEQIDDAVNFCYGKITDSPSDFVSIIRVVLPFFSKYLDNAEVVKKIIQSIYHTVKEDAHYAFHAVKILITIIKLGAEKELLEFRVTLLHFARQEAVNAKNILDDPNADISAITPVLMFLSELYIHLKVGNGRMKVIGKAVVEVMFTILFCDTLPLKDSLNSIVMFLKLVGTYLDEDDTTILDSFMTSLEQRLLLVDLDTNIASSVHSIVTLRANNWGKNENTVDDQNDETILDQVVEEVMAKEAKVDQQNQPNQNLNHQVNNQVWPIDNQDDGVFYGPDGNIIPHEEQLFLEYNATEVENDDQSELSSDDGMDSDMLAAYHEFLLSLPNARSDPSSVPSLDILTTNGGESAPSTSVPSLDILTTNGGESAPSTSVGTIPNDAVAVESTTSRTADDDDTSTSSPDQPSTTSKNDPSTSSRNDSSTTSHDPSTAPNSDPSTTTTTSG